MSKEIIGHISFDIFHLSFGKMAFGLWPLNEQQRA